MTRKLATVRRIDAIDPIPGADAIEVATVGGWKTVIAKKDGFKVGELAIYFEVDSWIPTELAPFLSKEKNPKVFNGIAGERLRTIKLRGQLSQGLLLPVPNGVEKVEGHDVGDLLQIQKWEKPIPAQLAGMMKGSFPSQIPKTDQERIQNIVKEVNEATAADLRFEVTEKLEGSSMTVYLIDGEFGVCSRNIDLKRDETNSFWAMAIKMDIERLLREAKMDNYAVQGELIGPGIQGNIYGLSEPEFYVYDIYNIKDGKYLDPMVREAVNAVWLGLKHVPIIEKRAATSEVQKMIREADGMSDINPDVLREGVVYKQVDGGMTFKVISNAYLLGEK